jgi:hypothetical protein
VITESLQNLGTRWWNLSTEIIESDIPDQFQSLDVSTNLVQICALLIFNIEHLKLNKCCACVRWTNTDKCIFVIDIDAGAKRTETCFLHIQVYFTKFLEM